jgi:hypothetical protein
MAKETPLVTAGMKVLAAVVGGPMLGGGVAGLLGLLMAGLVVPMSLSRGGMMAFCQHCGTQAEQGSISCANCGQPLRAPPRSSSGRADRQLLILSAIAGAAFLSGALFAVGKIAGQDLGSDSGFLFTSLFAGLGFGVLMASCAILRPRGGV